MAVQLKAASKRFEHADETRLFPHGKSELAKVGAITFAKITLEPGWHWKDDVAPVAKTSSCMVEHTQYILSGRIRITFDSGETIELKAGDVVYAPPGHDAWVLGNEPVVALEITGAADYAKPH
jgi:mannose-6-phosphate isomerase-like protein (cupin superfamily)